MSRQSHAYPQSIRCTNPGSTSRQDDDVAENNILHDKEVEWKVIMEKRPVVLVFARELVAVGQRGRGRETDDMKR